MIFTKRRKSIANTRSGEMKVGQGPIHFWVSCLEGIEAGNVAFWQRRWDARAEQRFTKALTLDLTVTLI
jgi:hypothetical protein